MLSRSCLVLGMVCATAAFSSSAQALSCPGSLPAGVMACYDVIDNIGLVVPFTPVSHNVGPGHSGTDEIWIVVDGPHGAADPGSTGTSALKFSAKPKPNKPPVLVSGLSSFSYVFTSTAPGGAPNTSGSLNTNGNDGFDLDLTATPFPGAPFDHYRLLLNWTTSGTTGGGYSYSLDISPCTICFNSTVPIPSAAVLFGSGLAGLGLLGVRRRRRAQEQAASDPASI